MSRYSKTLESDFENTSLPTNSMSASKIPTSVVTILNQCEEDPAREPHEKETAFHLEGNSTHFLITSFKKVVFKKLLQRPEFEVVSLNVIDADGRERTLNSLDEVAANPSLTIIGVVGRLPVGAMNIGTPRNSNSHADIVK